MTTGRTHSTILFPLLLALALALVLDVLLVLRIALAPGACFVC